MTEQPTQPDQPDQSDQSGSQQPDPQQHGSYQAPLPPAAPAAPPYKRLTRTSWDSPVSGVCGGIARYLGVDPTLIRVLAVIAMVFTFPVGPIVYAVLWAIIPKE
jgi:phage shock protein PspC (stress-responsive transcriptional regulator)